METKEQQCLLKQARERFVSEYGDIPENKGYPYYRCWHKRMFWMEISSVVYAESKQIADEYIKEYNTFVSVLDFSIAAVFLFAIGCFGLFYFEKTALIVTAVIALILVGFVFVFWLIRTYVRIGRKYEKQIIVFEKPITAFCE